MTSGRTDLYAEKSRQSGAVLEESARILDEVTALCVEQRDALARKNVDRLLVLGERAETLAARFRILEGARRVLEASGALDDPTIASARAALTDAAARAALAAASCADLLARTSAASAAVRRVLDGAQSAGYLPNGDVRPGAGPRQMEKTA